MCVYVCECDNVTGLHAWERNWLDCSEFACATELYVPPTL